MKRFWLVFACLACWQVACGYYNNYKFRSVGIDKGLSSNNVNAFLQDDAGFLWIATNSGLNRYDEYSFKVFENNPSDSTSIEENTVSKMYRDHEGNFWLQRYGRFTCVFNPQTERASTDNPLFHKKIPFDANFITNMKVDSSGNLWVSNLRFGLYYYNADTDDLQLISRNDESVTSLSSNKITSLDFDSQGGLWVCNQLGYIEKIDLTTQKVVRRVDFLRRENIGNDVFYEMYIDDDDDIWIFPQNCMKGVFFYSPSGGNVTHFSTTNSEHKLESNTVTSVVQDDNGCVWIGMDHGGVAIYDKKEKTLLSLKNNGVDPFSVCHNSITSLYKDNIGRIWVGTFKGGASIYHENQFRFRVLKNIPTDSTSLPYNDINCFAEDKYENIWIGTNGNGLLYYDRKKRIYKHFKHNPNNKNSLCNDIVVALYIDSKERLWIGTYNGGLQCYDGTSFRLFEADPNNPNAIADNKVWQIFEDSQKRLWIGTLGSGLDRYDEQQNKFIHYRVGMPNSIHSDFVAVIIEDYDQNIWIGSAYGVDKIDAETGKITQYLHNINNPNSLCGNFVLSMAFDNRGWLWIGTRSGLSCLDTRTGLFKNITIADGLPNNNIQTVCVDNNQNVWLGTLNGLCNIVIEPGKAFADLKYKIYAYDETDGIQGKEFNEHSVFKSKSGKLLFGGLNGFNVFDPEQIEIPQWKNKIVFTDLKLFNQSVKVGEGDKPILSKRISDTEKIYLKQKQNVFAIEFAALNNLYAEKTHYKYMLEGFNTDWTTIDAKQRSATFTNLSAGKYTFRVKSTDNDNEWSDDEIALSIVIVPPFYASKFAFALYYILFLATLIYLVYWVRNHERNKYILHQERSELEHQHEIDAMKIKFLTNISHEFRTPLTLILTPIDKLLKSDVTAETKTYLQMIKRNGKRLYNLVNQLLDIQKMEVGSVNYNPSFGNIVDFVKSTSESFVDLAESKKINFVFSSSLSELNTYFDHDKIEKILFNLLSNAFRYTPEDGKITITVEKNDSLNGNTNQNYVEIVVSDTGIGIDPAAKEHIFERFFQSNNGGEQNNQGTGIGLAIAHEFVKVHNGQIAVDSEVGKGTTFKVYLPINTDTVVSALAGDTNKNIEFKTRKADIGTTQITTEESDRRARVLIVEDNDDLRFYLRESLNDEFVVIEARNGSQALDIINKVYPDIVISDVMMPVMNGLDLCRILKNREDTSHIPIILLTAMTTAEQIKNGLEIGADDYITKPFNYDILLIKIRQQISLREKLRTEFSKKIGITLNDGNVTTIEEKFLQKIVKITEKSMEDPEFSVLQLSNELGVSRGHLYTKMLSLTGYKPSEFIRTMRMKKAALLLEKNQMAITEVAFLVGYNDSRYFAKHFKEEFNMTPTEYAKSKINK